MATAIPKISLSSSRDIPFNRLVLSQSNVRRVKSGLSIEELARDIERRGLLQSLNVRPVLDDAGVETGSYEVPAGGRRFRALELLVKQKKLAKTAPVPCVVREAGSAILAEDDSLAENVQRVALHPLDQFRAFRDMLEKGMSEEEVAAAFFVAPTVVRQRLRLMTVSDKLLDIYEQDGMNLEKLMAFSISDDHARQEQVWEIVSQSHNREPYVIRRMLTEKTVRASDRRVRFVGLDTYLAAGGPIMRDLFEADDGGWLQDPAILDRLVMEKLQEAAEQVRAEGWKWVETALSFPWGHTRQFVEIDGTEVPLTDEETARLEALRAEQEAIEAEYAQADEYPDEVDAQLGEIEQAILALEARPLAFDPADMARAGAFVSLASDGTLQVERGFVLPEDMPTEPEETDDAGSADEYDRPAYDGQDHDSTGHGYQEGDNIAPDVEPEEEDGIKPLPDRLLTELTAWRTLALRDAFASNPHIALTEMLHTLVRDVYWQTSGADCLEAYVREISLPVHSPDMPGSVPAHALRQRNEGWKHDLPDDEDALWRWIDGLDDASRMALLAHCLSFGVNALYERMPAYGAVSQRSVTERLKRADRLASALSLDLVEAGWQPTVENYLGRVTKARILQAVREARGDEAADRIAHLKKPDMAREAERLLDGSGWLPEALRTAGGAEQVPVETATVDEGMEAIAAE
ncbi:ParB/RepB/Spo0J family partition protein [Gluconacetobacter entanii]|uniref:ParB/RepB/Spo0J family partition protein n=3 Tax=Acetobacteraceae TaxID=433 RepID=A0ABT3K3J2_9PROT|nr:MULTISPECIES: ParB/RepB/Spo0J family partition protein [Acetobacteraceae]MBS0963675.1 ParB N-terminal domain-containing protein [Acetobacter persici]MBV0888907.1 ParB/RepB/Spo0J family partition protein [Komagataeibacter oboediens]MBV1831146.1 ParB/RepB/Spo0J family partition protein [Komagataeibacter melomenusus]MCW4589960.1 ParB/RepB/Spo0J family partition protein [Gluconacetobacter entanii]MCW4594098.1 ParB/RepB/Spo0J family partition protein [Gluconacetobacter entanii]